MDSVAWHRAMNCNPWNFVPTHILTVLRVLCLAHPTLANLPRLHSLQPLQHHNPCPLSVWIPPTPAYTKACHYQYGYPLHLPTQCMHSTVLSLIIIIIKRRSGINPIPPTVIDRD